MEERNLIFSNHLYLAGNEIFTFDKKDFNTLDDVLVYIYMMKKEQNHYDIYITYPCKSSCLSSSLINNISVRQAKELMEKFSHKRILILSYNLNEILGEYIEVETMYFNKEKWVSSGYTSCFFDYGLLYGSYPKYSCNDIMTTNFINNKNEWLYHNESIQPYDNTIIIANDNNSIDRLYDLKNTRFDSMKQWYGYYIERVVYNTETGEYLVDEYDNHDMTIPVACLTKVSSSDMSAFDIVNKFNIKEEDN